MQFRKWSLIAGMMAAFMLSSCGADAGETAEATSSASASAESTSEEETPEEETAESLSISVEESTSSEGEETVEEVSASSAEEDPIMSLPLVADGYELEDCIQLADYKNLDISLDVEEVTDEAVDAYIHSLLEPVDIEDKTKALEEGDTAVLDFVGKLNGEAFAGGTGTDYPLEIGSGTFIPGFEEGMVGMKIGEERDLELTFPEDYPSEDLAGQNVVFTVTLKSIQQMPVLDDAWVKKYTNDEMQTVEEFRASNRETMEQQNQEFAETMAMNDAWTQLMENSTFLALPESYVTEGREGFDQYIDEEAEMYGYEDRETYLNEMGMSEEDYVTYRDSSARSEARSRLLNEALMKAEQVSAEGEEYQAAEEKLATMYGLSRDELIEQFGERAVEEYILTELLMKRVLSYNLK